MCTFLTIYYTYIYIHDYNIKLKQKYNVKNKINYNNGLSNII